MVVFPRMKVFFDKTVVAQNIFVAKYQSGEQLWRQDTDFPSINTANAITVDDRGNVYIA